MPWYSQTYTEAVGYVKPNSWVPYPGSSVTTETRTNSAAVFSSDSKPSTKKNPLVGGWRNPSAYSRTVDYRRNYVGEQRVWLGTSSTFDQYSLRSGAIGNTTYLSSMDTSVPKYDGSLISRAEIKALLKLKDQRINYSVFLAQAKQGIDQISQAIMELTNAYRFARRGQWPRAASALRIGKHAFKAPSKEFSKRWLELQYGWLPLLSDVHSAYEDSRKGLTDYEPRVSAKAVVRVKCAPPPPFTDKWGTRYTFDDDSHMGCLVRLDYTLNSDGLRIASKTGLTNPSMIAWEVLPFSFVLDWLVPVGNWLDCFDADLGLTFKGGSRTTFMSIDRKGIAFKVGGSRRSTVEFCDAVGVYRLRSMDRTLYLSTPHPGLYLKNPVSAVHALNAIALLRGLFH